MDTTILERKYIVKVLLSLYKSKGLRFKDLKKTVDREATLSSRIKELEELNLIESTVIREKRRKFFAYSLTSKGQSLGKLLHEIEAL